FYPDDLPARYWLEAYAQHFRTVEINNTFYRLPEKATFEAWARRTPADFVFAPKLSRYLSHVRRLREPAEPAALFLERARPLAAHTRAPARRIRVTGARRCSNGRSGWPRHGRAVPTGMSTSTTTVPGVRSATRSVSPPRRASSACDRHERPTSRGRRSATASR